jgi:integrase
MAGKRGHGEGSIGLIADGRWRGRVMVGYRLDGKPDRRVVYGKTRGECQKKLDDLRSRAAAGLLGDAAKERELVSQYLEEWVTVVKTKVRETTWKRYAEIVRLHIVPRIGRLRLAGLRPADIQRLYAGLLAQTDELTGFKKYSPRTVHHCHAVLHRAIEMAVKWGYVSVNVCDRVDPPRVPRREMSLPSFEDLTRLIDTAESGDDPLAALWTVALYSGCRQGELLALQWSDIDLDNATVRVRRSLIRTHRGVPEYGEPKSGKSRRSVKLAQEAVSALRAHRDRQAWNRQKLGEDYATYNLVFATPIGTALTGSAVSHRFRTALKRAEITTPMRFHDLRHAAATLMLAAGVDAKTASTRLGHSTIAITMDLYTHAVQALDDHAANAMQDALRRRTGS